MLLLPFRRFTSNKKAQREAMLSRLFCPDFVEKTHSAIDV
jgi:hypothetical protein